MTKNDLNLARKKFILAQKFLIDINSYIELAENTSEDLINFIEMINGKSLIKEHMAFDLIKDKTIIKNNLKQLLPEVFNQDFIDDVAKSLLKSYPSLLSLRSYDGKKTEIYDNFMQKNYYIYNSNMEDFSNKTFLARIIEFNGYKFIISFVSQFEDKQKDFFLESLRQLFFYKGFYEFRSKDMVEDMKDFLKKYFLDILITYTIDLTNKIKDNDDQLLNERESKLLSQMFSDKKDLEIFKSFAKTFSNKFDFNKSRIVFVFDDIINSLGKNMINFSDPTSYNIEKIIEKNCKNGGFFIDDQLKEIVNILSDFFFYAKDKDSKFLKSYEEISRVSKNIFTYIGYLKESKSGLYFDQNLLNFLEDMQTCSLLDKFYAYLNTINEANLRINKNKDRITDSGIQKLANSLGLSPIKNVKKPNQSHYPLLEFFFNFLYKKGFIESKDGEISLSDRINKLLYLKNKEKIAIFIYYFLNKNFMLSFLNKQKYENILDKMITVFKNIKESKLSFTGSRLNKIDVFVIKTLKSLNLIKMKNHTISTSPLGEEIYDYYLSGLEKDNIINLENYFK